VFQLVQIYLATDNERPINQTAMFESNRWSMRQEKTTPNMVEYVCQSDTVLANIITKLVLARQQVQSAIKLQCEPEPEPEPVEIPLDNVKHEIKSEQLEVMSVESMNNSDGELPHKRQRSRNEQVEVVNVRSTADREVSKTKVTRFKYSSRGKLSVEQNRCILAICRDVPLLPKRRGQMWDERVRLVREQLGVTLKVDRLRQIVNSEAKETSGHTEKSQTSHVEANPTKTPSNEMQTEKIRGICRQMNGKSWRVKAKAITDQLGLTYDSKTLKNMIRALEASVARKSLNLRPGGIMTTHCT